ARPATTRSSSGTSAYRWQSAGQQQVSVLLSGAAGRVDQGDYVGAADEIAVGDFVGDPLHFGAIPCILPHLEPNKIDTFARSHVHDDERIDRTAAARELGGHGRRLAPDREQREAGAGRIDGAAAAGRVAAQSRRTDEGIHKAAPPAELLQD